MLPSNVIHKTDPRGAPVIGVPLSKGAGVAWLDADDYAAIVAELGDVAWFVIHNGKGRPYVRLHNPHKRTDETIARIITGRGVRTGVSYADEDRLNLRRSNLIVQRGSGGRPKRRRGVARTRRGNTTPGGIAAPF